MTEATESALFRQKLYNTFQDSGLLSKLKTSLRTSLLERLQKPAPQPNPHEQQLDKLKPFHLKSKFLHSIIAEYLAQTHKQYSLSIFMAECNLENDDCLQFAQLAEIVNLNGFANEQPFLFRLIEQYSNSKCSQVKEKSSQTDFQQPLGKKMQIIEKEYKAKIDYWKLVPNTKISNVPESVYQQEQKLRAKFNLEKEQLKNELHLSIKAETEKKYENQYLFRMKEVTKQHDHRLNQLKNREKMILEGLERKTRDLEEKAKKVSDDELRMINKYQTRFRELVEEFRQKEKEIEKKEKEFWKKELELKAKKRQYEDTIRLVKQKVINESSL